MAESNLDIIGQIINSIEVIGDGTISVNGNIYTTEFHQAHNNWDGPYHTFGNNENVDASPKTLEGLLTNTIYKQFYSQGGIDSDEPPTPAHLIPGFKKRQDEFMSHLYPSIKTTMDSDPFWKVYSWDGHMYYITKNGYSKPLYGGFYRLHNPSKSLSIGSYVHLDKPRADRRIQDFFLYIFGNRVLSDELDLLRFYFNMNPNHVGSLVESITTTLNYYDIPFTFKCLNEPNMYHRADNCVLYIDMRYHSILPDIIYEIYAPIAAYSNPATPLFTQQLSPGLGFAEDPGQGKSFGLNRCRFIAQLIAKYKSNINQQLITKEFNQKGLNIEHLHLRPYSPMQYGFETKFNTK